MDPLALVALGLGLAGFVAGWWRGQRLRRTRLANAYEHVFQADLADALRIWGGAQVFAALAWILRFDRFDMPLWSGLVLLLGASAALIAWWRSEHADWPRLAHALPEEAPPRAESETWQYGLIAAAMGIFIGYLLGFAVGFMQPIHVLLALFVGIASYPIGLAFFSPKAVIRAGGLAAS